MANPDVENRLVSVTKGAHRTEFEYDPLGRRSRILEKDADGQGGWTTGSDKRYLWEGAEIVEEEAANGSTLKAFYGQGFVDTDGTALFYTRDHLGSVRELVDMSGTVRARYDYDPYGRVTKVLGDRDSLFLYTGHLWHAQSGLFLTLFRAYDPALGRWISRDPLQEEGGINLYAYVANSPTGLIDPLGLSWSDFAKGAAISIGVGILVAVTLGAILPALGVSALAIAMIKAVVIIASGVMLVRTLERMANPCISNKEWDFLAGGLFGGILFGAAYGGAEGGVDATPDDLAVSADDTMTLFRGVHDEHAGYGDAQNGEANPQGGDATPAEHNAGNTKSDYTSWSRDRSVAVDAAADSNGVVLQRTFHRSEWVVSPDKYGEAEVLIRGRVTGAGVTKP